MIILNKQSIWARPKALEISGFCPWPQQSARVFQYLVLICKTRTMQKRLFMHHSLRKIMSPGDGKCKIHIREVLNNSRWGLEARRRSSSLCAQTSSGSVVPKSISAGDGHRSDTSCSWAESLSSDVWQEGRKLRNPELWSPVNWIQWGFSWHLPFRTFFLSLLNDEWLSHSGLLGFSNY